MKLTMKIFLLISIFCATTFADEGDMGSGNKDGSSGGGLACAECVVENNVNDLEKEDSILIIIQDFLNGLLG